MSELVECRSEHSYPQRPIAFEWEGERLEIESIQAQWQTPAAKHFHVVTADRGAFELVYNPDKDTWDIVRI